MIKRSMRHRTRAEIGVAKPDAPSRYWAEVRVNAGPYWNPIAGCGNPARKGFLTCPKHASREEAAQLLLGPVIVPMDFS
jgi:hypothetical protein